MNSIELPRLTDTQRMRIRQSKDIRGLVAHPEIQGVISDILDKPTDRHRELALADAMRRASFRQLYDLLCTIANSESRPDGI